MPLEPQSQHGLPFLAEEEGCEYCLQAPCLCLVHDDDGPTPPTVSSSALLDPDQDLPA